TLSASGVPHHARELGERLALDLPHALAREPDDLADLLQRHRFLALAQSVAQAQDRRLALVDALEQLLQPTEQVGLLDLLLGRVRTLVLDRLLRVRHGLERDLRARGRRVDGLLQEAPALGRDAELARHLLDARRSTEAKGELATDHAPARDE